MKTSIKASIAIAAILGVTAGHVALASEAVEARQAAMKAIGGASGTLGKMARGKMDYDKRAAQSAAQTIAEKAAMIPALFKDDDFDMTTEASPAIWNNFDDFTAKAMALQVAAENAASKTSLTALKGAMGDLGAACGSCHRAYREK